MMIGQRIGNYHIIEKLGQGGMGEVYKAKDDRLKRLVAIKVLRNDKGAARGGELRFLQEARAASALNHSNIVQIYELAVQDGNDYIVMEFAPGRTLAQVLSEKRLSVEEVLDYASQIASALAAAHAAHIVHRDIKPGNIIVSDSGVVKILDFGLAKLEQIVSESDCTVTAGPETATGAVFGTVSYMSPEQAEAKPVDARSDIFSTGAVLYEMFTGKRAFDGDSTADTLSKVLRDDVRDIRELRAEAPRNAARIVSRCLEKNPEMRYSSGRELASELIACQRPARAVTSPNRARVLTAAALVAIAGAGFWTWRERASITRAKSMQQVERLADAGAMIEAYRLAMVLDERNPKDPAMRRIWDAVGPSSPIVTDPPGADVYIRDYLKPDSEWLLLGRSPLQPGRLPELFISLRVAKQGYTDVEWALRPTFVPPLKLTPVESAPPGMVYVLGKGWAGQAVALDDFWLDRYEVTNAEYKKFVDAGGYRERTFWKQPFVEGARTLSWEQSMAKFVDATGRPGPANWDLGSYPEGAANMPVTGVSWFEAAAYAQFAGKELPTVHHWRQAALYQSISSEIIQLSNFEGKGLAARGKFKGASFFGSFDMAGNAKEWCWNATGEKRYILGGAWSEPSYLFIDNDARSPFDRAETFGFRCVRYSRPPSDNLMAPVNRKMRDYAIEKPVSEEHFKFYLNLFAYDRTPLDQKVEAVNETDPNWRMETITFNAAYGNERVTAYLFVPPKAKPPYQTVVHFPGGYALFMDKVDSVGLHGIRHFIQSGRAVLYPIYKGTYQRKTKSQPRTSLAWRDQVVQICKDLGRSIDYLETRNDIDRSKIAYHGISLGSVTALPCIAVEPRLKTAILQGGGLSSGALAPEIDPVNFAPRVRFPVLMISGRNDFQFPVEQLQRPLFRLLGSAAADKRHFLVEGGHVVPRNLVVKESLDWLDKYLGPVAGTR